MGAQAAQRKKSMKTQAIHSCTRQQSDVFPLFTLWIALLLLRHTPHSHSHTQQQQQQQSKWKRNRRKREKISSMNKNKRVCSSVPITQCAPSAHEKYWNKKKKHSAKQSNCYGLLAERERATSKNIHVVCIVFALNKCAPRSFGFISFSLAALFVHAFSSFSVLPNRFFLISLSIETFLFLCETKLTQKKKNG